MPPRDRHCLPKVGKPPATHLPAQTRPPVPGEPTDRPRCGLAYLGRMGGTTLSFLRGIAQSAGRPRIGRLVSAAAGEGSAQTYWRRRFILLVVGLVLFGLAAWGVSDAIAVTPRPTAPARHGGHGQGGRSAEAAGGHPPAKTTPGSQPGRKSAPSRHHGAQPTVSKRAPSTGTAGQPSGQGTILPVFCARSNIVLSIFSGQTQYASDQRPTFDLNVVSTQRTGCSFNLGSAHLILVIKEGATRIWTSADCAKGTSGLITELSRGVPTVLPIVWSRKTSSPGCSGPTSPAPAGAYTAYATDNGVKSQTITFRLG